MRANYGLTRIDQPRKGNHGYFVRLVHRGQMHCKWFPDGQQGARHALAKARVWRDLTLAKLPGKVIVARRRNIPQCEVPGVTHVTLANSRYEYWQAMVRLPDRRKVAAKFSVRKFGFERAREMAIAAVARMRTLTHAQ